MSYKFAHTVLSILIAYATYQSFSTMSVWLYIGLILLCLFLIGWNTLSIHTDNYTQPISYLLLSAFLSISITVKYIQSYVSESATALESMSFLILGVLFGLFGWFFIGVIMSGLLDSLTDIDVRNNTQTNDPYNDAHAERILNED